MLSGYEGIALRLLSAVILGWDRLPLATQGWIMRDAFMMENGVKVTAPEVLMAFIDANKDAPEALISRSA